MKIIVRCFARGAITISLHSKVTKYINVCMDKALHEEFEAFCKAHEMSKVGATEQAIRQYIDRINKALKNVR